MSLVFQVMLLVAVRLRTVINATKKKKKKKKATKQRSDFRVTLSATHPRERMSSIAFGDFRSVFFLFRFYFSPYGEDEAVDEEAG